MMKWKYLNIKHDPCQPKNELPLDTRRSVVFTVYIDENNIKKGSSPSQWITSTEQTATAINWLVAIPSILISLFSLVS